MDKIRGETREQDAREREALQRESQRQARDLEERQREERERSRMGTADIADRARAMRDADADTLKREPVRGGEQPAGRLRDADVEDAVQIVRRDAPAGAREVGAVETPSGGAQRAAARAAEARATDAERTSAIRAAQPGAGDAPAARAHNRQPRADEQLAPLFHADVAQGFRSRWDATQIGFVDDPRHAVQQADELVAEVMQSLAQSFADERRQLEAQMNETASTENLRVALQRYRSFFQRLLSL
jgi:hypothetical protein